MSSIFRYFIWFLASLGAAAIALSVLFYFTVATPHPENAPAKVETQTSRLAPSGQEMQAVPQIDFSAGPVDLIVTENGKDWLVRDQALVQKAAETGVPDTSGDETKLLFMSILFLSPPGTGPDRISLTFRRGDQVLARIACMQSACGRMPELRNLLDPLVATGQPIESQYESFTDYDAYLKAYERIEKSADRYGSIDPPAPEERKKLDNKLAITFPVLYRKSPAEGWLTPIRQSYEQAVRAEFADAADQFSLDLSEEAGAGMYLARCSDGSQVMSNDQTQPVFPPDWEFAVISGNLWATRKMAGRLAEQSVWEFLPKFDSDNNALTRDIVATVDLLSDRPDPDDCYSVENAPNGGNLSIWRDYPYSYSISWTQILPKGAP